MARGMHCNHSMVTVCTACERSKSAIESTGPLSGGPGLHNTQKEAMMLSLDPRTTRGKPWSLLSLGALAMIMAVTLGIASQASAGGGGVAGKWGGAIDAEALQVLKGMTDYLEGLQTFSMHTENTFEDVLATGQKIQFHFESSVVAQRPDKLRVKRTDGTAQQLFVYDGAEFSIYDPQQDIVAVIDAPATIDGFLHFARDQLDLVPPAGDMVYSNAFELLTNGMTSGFVVGETVIAGTTCVHLAFTTPVVDWQVWIATGDKPLPVKYVLTTTDDPTQPQFITTISDWNTDPEIKDGLFEFKPPTTAMEIDFIRVDPLAW